MNKLPLFKFNLRYREWASWRLLGIDLLVINPYEIFPIIIRFGRWEFNFQINRLKNIQKSLEEEDIWMMDTFEPW